jgi:hypothetical protein
MEIIFGLLVMIGGTAAIWAFFEIVYKSKREQRANELERLTRERAKRYQQ